MNKIIEIIKNTPIKVFVVIYLFLTVVASTGSILLQGALSEVVRLEPLVGFTGYTSYQNLGDSGSMWLILLSEIVFIGVFVSICKYLISQNKGEVSTQVIANTTLVIVGISAILRVITLLFASSRSTFVYEYSESLHLFGAYSDMLWIINSILVIVGAYTISRLANVNFASSFLTIASSLLITGFAVFGIILGVLIFTPA